MTVRGVAAGIAGAYEPNAFTAGMVSSDARRALTSDLDVDACVIGGGLAGLAIALELARTGWSVAVLEARRIGWNASGRNIGMVAPGFGVPVERIVARVGLDHAKRLWALSAAGVERIRESVADNAMPGVSPVDGRLVVSPPGGASLDGAADRLREDFAADVEAWPAERVQAALTGKAHGPALHFPGAFRIHALNYALGLAAAVENAGGRIFEGTRALAIDSDGVRKRVQTTGGRVRAGRIVLASGDEGGSLHPLLDATVITLARPTARTAPLGERLSEVLPFTGIVEHATSPAVRYHADGDSLLWQGPLTTARKAGWSTALRLRGQMRRAYPLLGRPQVAHTWLAPIVSTVHGMPQIGELAPGLWVAAAFGDHSINTTAMAADLIARGVRDGDDRWRLFTPYGLVWTGGKAGRTVVALALKGAAAAAFFRRHLPRRAPQPAVEPVPALVAAPGSIATAATIAFAAPIALAARPVVTVTAKVEMSILPAAAHPEPPPALAEERAAAPVPPAVPEPAPAAAEPTAEARPVERVPGDLDPKADAPPAPAAEAEPQVSAPSDPAAASEVEAAEAAATESLPAPAVVSDAQPAPAVAKKKRQRTKPKSTATAATDDGAAAPKTVRGVRKRGVRAPASEAAKISRKRRSPRAGIVDSGRPVPGPTPVPQPPPAGGEPT